MATFRRLVVATVLAVAATLVAATAHGDLARQFVELPEAARIYEHLAVYTAQPHRAGTPEDYATALYTQQQLKGFGIEHVEIETENVLLHNPISSSLELVQPENQYFRAKLQEACFPEDPTSCDSRVLNTPTFNAYSASGNVTAELVYANYGTLEDFRFLESQNISVKGRVVLVRYGSIFRGLKVMLAQQRGASAVLIYSDPADDGFARGEEYPKGPWRPASGVQRGSIQFISLCAGDPQDERVRAKCGITREDLLPQIPVQPISWEDALPLMGALSGSVAPPEWQGKMPLNSTYNIGPGPATVRLSVQAEQKVGPIWNVVAKIPGRDRSRAVLLGNHRDAWVYGAVDPNSGTASMLELARSITQLMQQSGWQPESDIWFLSWDGEEFGLLGSTAFGERHAEELQRKAIAYLNVDVAVTGSKLDVSATQSLVPLIRRTAEMVTDPNTGKALSQVWDGQVALLGSGSDYTVFLDALGITSLDMSFSGNYGVYHSAYDSMNWMWSFGDPEFRYHRLMSQFWGLIALQLADPTTFSQQEPKERLPFDFVYYADQLAHHTDALEKMLDDPKKLDLTALRDAISRFRQAGVSADQERDLDVSDLNDRLMMVERQFLSTEGLPQRTWFKHILQAPGLYAGYASDAFPGVKQCVRTADWQCAAHQMQILANRILGAAKALSPSGTTFTIDIVEF